MGLNKHIGNAMKIAVAGLGYVGMSNAVLLAQKFDVVAIDLSSERVDMVNNKISPIQAVSYTHLTLPTICSV